VGGIGDDLHRKLSAAGVLPERVKVEATTIGGLVRYVNQLRADAKPRTLTNLKQAGAKLTDHFGEGRPLDRITPGDVDGFVTAIRQAYSPAYVARLIKYGKQFFHAARRAGLVEKSPFDGVTAGTMANADRMYFLTHEDAQKILAACPDVEWRLIFALARYGGLRCPSEVVALTWEDVDWGRGRFLVKAPKTAHHADGGRRWVPLFPELRPHLEAAFERAEPGAVYIVARTRSHETNLRTGLERIIYRAGLLPALAEAVPEPAGDPGNGAGRPVPAARRDGLDWQLGAGRGQALPPGHGRRFRPGDGPTTHRRRTDDAQNDAVCGRRGGTGRDRRSADPRKSCGFSAPVTSGPVWT
jgi:integrase